MIPSGMRIRARRIEGGRRRLGGGSVVLANLRYRVILIRLLCDSIPLFSLLDECRKVQQGQNLPRRRDNGHAARNSQLVPVSKQAIQLFGRPSHFLGFNFIAKLSNMDAQQSQKRIPAVVGFKGPFLSGLKRHTADAGQLQIQRANHIVCR